MVGWLLAFSSWLFFSWRLKTVVDSPVIIEAAALFINMTEKEELIRQLEHATSMALAGLLELAANGEESLNADLQHWRAVCTALLEEIENQ